MLLIQKLLKMSPFIFRQISQGIKDAWIDGNVLKFFKFFFESLCIVCIISKLKMIFKLDFLENRALYEKILFYIFTYFYMKKESSLFIISNFMISGTFYIYMFISHFVSIVDLWEIVFMLICIHSKIVI